MAIGLAVVVGVVPASSAQTPRVLGQGKAAATGIETEERPTHDEMTDELRSDARERTGISLPVPIGSVSVEVPTGRVSVDPEFLDGEPVYVLRTTVGNGITIVEASTTPFMPVLAGVDALTVRSDQPASW